MRAPVVVLLLASAHAYQQPGSKIRRRSSMPAGRAEDAEFAAPRELQSAAVQLDEAWLEERAREVAETSRLVVKPRTKFVAKPAAADDDAVAVMPPPAELAPERADTLARLGYTYDASAARWARGAMPER